MNPMNTSKYISETILYTSPGFLSLRFTLSKRYGIRKSEKVMMKNIIALKIPTFITKDNEDDALLFSNFTKARSKKNIESAISKSNRIIKESESGFPKSNRKINRRTTESKNSCNCVLAIFLRVLTIFINQVQQIKLLRPVNLYLNKIKRNRLIIKEFRYKRTFYRMVEKITMLCVNCEWETDRNEKLYFQLIC